MKLGIRAVMAVMAVVGLQLGGCLDVDEAKKGFCKDNPERCREGAADAGDAGDAGQTPRPDGGQEPDPDGGQEPDPDGGGVEDPDSGPPDLGPLNLGWNPRASMKDARAFHTATRLKDGKVLVVGGSSSLNVSGPVIQSAEIFDPALNLWTRAGYLKVARARHTATLLGNGKVLIVGGNNASGQPLKSVELYDPANGGSWSEAAPLSTERYGHDAVRLSASGEVLVIGGGTAETASVESVEVYDPELNKWSTRGTLPAGRHRVVATEISGDRVLAVGGSAGVTTSDLYQHSTKSWTAIAATSQVPRVGHSVTRLNNGEILVAGSVNAALTVYWAETDILSENSLGSNWASAGTLNVPRSHHTATLLDSGDVLVAGGTKGIMDSLDVVQIYSPGAGWSPPGAAMLNKRAFHRATLLRSGNVLVTGGLGNSELDPELNAVELYMPPPPRP
ncbi:kelch domain-containing protein [Myxococcus stipitatus DSM 14675]|uniref:Kelch domain-containing protein n=1 Tax=Myxococcus stipitatus (strain DSM 14675 / JCM 12634 / Mx s8) TaxID=1278073 RepID=L7URQ5_MYXSD|nr:kelch repeat-containing protein [Myxococcus stipitatus]AGC49304.1 kelch domain-containing protein [Myxococcus stipitatus DSM 14675]